MVSHELRTPLAAIKGSTAEVLVGSHLPAPAEPKTFRPVRRRREPCHFPQLRQWLWRSSPRFSSRFPVFSAWSELWSNLVSDELIMRQPCRTRSSSSEFNF